jgi:hypothetical protein
VSEAETIESHTSVSWWQAVLFTALAGGMGWGIRGQYGHELGAMIPGVLVSLTLVLLLCPKASSRQVVLAVAWGTVAMGFGGNMTYGQTLGLTQNAPVIGNWEALRWGLLGTTIKGALWIGFAGLFLGMGLGGKRYRPLEMLVLMFAAVSLYFLGIALFNAPHDPDNRILPSLYFSASWYWEPSAGQELEPRPECWGGLLVALAALMAYTGFRRKDGLAVRMALWGLLGGGLGFTIGQCFQSYHAWNPAVFDRGIWVNLDPHMNWWNVMETVFGTIMGAALGLGLWTHRKRINLLTPTDRDYMPVPLEWLLLGSHVILVVNFEYVGTPAVDALYDIGLILGIIPIVIIASGRWAPYFMVLPVTLLPIAGDTIQELILRDGAAPLDFGLWFYLVVPLTIATLAAVWFTRQAQEGQTARGFTSRALLLTAWIYFLLNFAEFRYPWPWAEWTGRTPSGIVFTLCVLALTALALTTGRREPAQTGGT